MYSVFVEPTALQDIQQAIDHYESQQAGLGEKFEKSLNQHFASLSKNPSFQVRYLNVRCLPVRKYSYMIHFTIDEENKSVVVRALFHTSRSPEIWADRR